MKSLRNHIIHITSYYPPHLGGMENCVKYIVGELAKKGFAVKVLTSNKGLENVDEREKYTEYLKSIEFAHTPIIFNLFFKLMRIPKNSIMHLHVSQAFTPEVVYVVSKLRNIPYIAHIHLDVDPSGPFGFLLGPYKKIFLRPVLRNASSIICLSESQKTAIADKYDLNKDKIVVIPNGVAKKFFVKRKIEKKEITKLLFVGRLAPQKNVKRLIQAMGLMKQNVTLQIVGDGEEREEIKKLIFELNLKNIKLLGKKTDNELISIYKQADIFVLPSNKEGIPLALLEAMAAGLPIVASDIPGVNELLGEAGILVKNPSPKSFAVSLDSLVADIKLQKILSKKAQLRADNFKWEKLSNKIEDMYERRMYEK